MTSKSLTHADADLVLRLYELRREPVMRESRNLLNMKFWPKTAAEATEIMTAMDHPMNAAIRQCGSYWEMVYGFAKHGIIDADFLVESNGEGLYLYAKFAPFIKEVREVASPTAFTNAQWIAEHSAEGRRRMEMITARIKKMVEGK